MYIVDDVAYAGEPEKPIRVASVRPLDDYRLWLRFSNGETRIFDCAKLFEYPIFQKLQDEEIFKGVYVDYGIPMWCDGELDYCPDTLYAESVPT